MKKIVEPKGEINKIQENIIFRSKTNRNILIYINKKGFDYAINVSRGIKGTFSDVGKGFKQLKEERLIELIKNEGKKKYPFVCKSKRNKYFRLTNKGKRIVGLLLEIKKEFSL